MADIVLEKRNSIDGRLSRKESKILEELKETYSLSYDWATLKKGNIPF